MNIPYKDYYHKVEACFAGKCIGGTLGMPFESFETMHSIDYYDPIPKEMLPNDDLDLQVVFLESIRRYGLPIHRGYLLNAWKNNIRMVYDEYGIAYNNICRGITPPLSGYYNNKFGSGMGAMIRSELWACLCPANPCLAASLAREDACADHYGDGVDATCFWAAIESAAFTETNQEKLLQIGFSFLREGRLRNALLDTIKWWKESKDIRLVREKIVSSYYVQNFTDVSLNLSFIILGWLSGNSDFGESICSAVNCGFDTDCTGASLGSLLGIINPNGIESKWREPIGNKLVLSPNIVGVHEVDTIGEFCNQIAEVSQAIQSYYCTSVQIGSFSDKDALPAYHCPKWKDDPLEVGIPIEYKQNESVVCITPIYMVLCHPKCLSVSFGSTQSYSLKLRLLQKNSKSTYKLSLRVPNGWSVTPSECQIEITDNTETVVSFFITPPSKGKNVCYNPLDIELINDKDIYTFTAGLITPISWLRQKLSTPIAHYPTMSLLKKAHIVNSNGFSQTVPSGRYLYALELKPGVPMNNGVMVCQGTRRFRVWLNNTVVGQSDGTYYVPAVHRGPGHTIVNLEANWSTLFVEVDDGPEGEIFIGFAKPYGLEWVDQFEYRVPATFL